MKVQEKKEDKLKFKRKSQKQNKLHKILITVLVPLMFGILLTTLFSILVILLLSEYWANQGANSLAQQQYIYQTCTFKMIKYFKIKLLLLISLKQYIKQPYYQFIQLAITTLLGNSQKSIFQTISTIRAQIIHSFWSQYQESQSIDLKSIQMPQVVQLSTKPEFILYYDNNTNQCLYCIGWGIVDVNNLISINSQLEDLNLEQYTQLQQIVKTFQILQILYMVDNYNQCKTIQINILIQKFYSFLQQQFLIGIYLLSFYKLNVCSIPFH